jgi:RimJ/RimL family protein N-acetyltransferase
MVNAITTQTTVTTSDWKSGLPVLAGTGFTMRELRLEDAASLLAMLTTEEVSRFISPPPTTVEGFERFIMWTQRERQAGNYACFAWCRPAPTPQWDLPGAAARLVRHGGMGP